jgi:hypothetical protein
LLLEGQFIIPAEAGSVKRILQRLRNRGNLTVSERRFLHQFIVQSSKSLASLESHAAARLLQPEIR